VLVTSERLYRKKVHALRPSLPKLQYVLLIDADQDQDNQTLSLSRLLANASPEFIIPPTDPEDMALLHFTSGTTGRPKGAL
jgi:acetyl-CoA synthetase